MPAWKTWKKSMRKSKAQQPEHLLLCKLDLISISHVPHSSNLDCGPELQSVGDRGSHLRDMSEKKGSFDDTSKDVSDIEDWDIEEESSFDISEIR